MIFIVSQGNEDLQAAACLHVGGIEVVHGWTSSPHSCSPPDMLKGPCRSTSLTGALHYQLLAIVVVGVI